MHHIKNHLKRPSRIFLTDNALEYRTNELQNYYSSQGITKENPVQRKQLGRTHQYNDNSNRMPTSQKTSGKTQSKIKFTNTTLHSIIQLANHHMKHGTATKHNPRSYSCLGNTKWLQRVNQNPNSHREAPLPSTCMPKHRGISQSWDSTLIPGKKYMQLTFTIIGFPLTHASPTNQQHNAQLLTTSSHPPQVIQIDTPAPPTTSHASRYPEGDKWQKTHDVKLTKLKNIPSIKWLPDSDVPNNATKVHLTIGYRYKRDNNGFVIQNEARCS